MFTNIWRELFPGRWCSSVLVRGPVYCNYWCKFGWYFVHSRDYTSCVLIEDMSGKQCGKIVELFFCIEGSCIVVASREGKAATGPTSTASLVLCIFLMPSHSCLVPNCLLDIYVGQTKYGPCLPIAAATSRSLFHQGQRSYAVVRPSLSSFQSSANDV